MSKLLHHMAFPVKRMSLGTFKLGEWHLGRIWMPPEMKWPLACAVFNTTAAFNGTAADGAACAASGDCASGYCHREANSDCGQCATPYLAEGTDCSTSLAGCASGLRCDSSTKKCTSAFSSSVDLIPAAVGEACNVMNAGPPATYSQCDGGGYCSLEENGICLARSDLHEACTMPNEDSVNENCPVFYDCHNGFCEFPPEPVCQ